MGGFNLSDTQNDSVRAKDCFDVVKPALVVDESLASTSSKSPDDVDTLRAVPSYAQNYSKRKTRDPTWLQVEVCREYLRGECTRSQVECKFAHPKPTCVVENGRVTTCFDSLKERCTRECCKYFHPPKHIKYQIQHLGRSHQRSDYNYFEIDISEHLGYPLMPAYGYWFPWNPYLSNEEYQYGEVIPNYDYNNYCDGLVDEHYTHKDSAGLTSVKQSPQHLNPRSHQNSDKSPKQNSCAVYTEE